MNKLVLILVFSLSVFSQARNETLYLKGLQACLDKEFESYSKFTERDLRDVIVAYEFDLTRELPAQLGETRIQYLSDYDLAEKVKALPKAKRERGIPFIKIFPLINKDDKLTFAYNNYWFTYNEKGGFLSRKKISFGRALEGGCHAQIGFDSEQKRFVIEKVKLWGV